MTTRTAAFQSVVFCVMCFALLVWHEQSSARPAALSEPRNLGDFKQELTAYKRSGAYDRDVAAALAKAQQYVERRAGLVQKPAIVLDIDETSLSNWPQIAANDYGRFTGGPCDALPAGPCGQTAWQARGQDEPIVPTLTLYKVAKSKGVSVFFLTGRSETLRAATESNLRKVGYDGWSGVIMRPAGSSTPSAADYKVPERAKIAAQGYTIIANVGDQPSDLAGGYAERTFLVPNPFYRIP
ncbi:MAG TPA: HAD family acid phosphatase [Terriglobia bacterium]|nr:HAD family acid phosphatase [Terriglobia bacterium]